MNDLILWLDDAGATDPASVGPKAARLALMTQAGFPVPPGFIVPIDACSSAPADELEQAIRSAYCRLQGTGSPACPVAARSSAAAEDQEGASFAGLQETVLNVMDERSLLAAIQRVRSSVESEGARAYRERVGVEGGGIAVLVQRQVEASVSGIAFARDPISGEDALVVEAIAGLGEALASGQAEPQAWRLVRQPDGSLVPALAPAEPLLDGARLEQLIAWVERLGEQFGGPQDVEWALDQEQLWLLQSRPITGRREDWFTDHLPDDHFLWTAAFLNERFTEPVSPLGWSLVAAPLERLALRGPLELLGAAEIEGPLLKLWRGHPYSRVEAWQRIYKLFPDPLLPEDAARYFPAGDLSLRHAPDRPTLGLHLLWNALRVLRGAFSAASPLHNPGAWGRYERLQRAALIRLRFEERQLARLAEPIPAARSLLAQSADLTEKLLELHRWSLLYADISYSLLRRLLILRHGPEEGGRRAVVLTATVDSPTTEMNRALDWLALRVAEDGTLRALVEGVARGEDEPETLANRGTKSGEFGEALREFLERYGHRFFSLDLYDPPWEADLPGFARFLLALARKQQEERSEGPAEGAAEPLWARPFLHLTRHYLRMREAQRFHWQQLLALQRRVILQMGEWWVSQGDLDSAEELFALTWMEVMEGRPPARRARTRLARLKQLRRQARQAPGWHYPDFLRGGQPLRVPLAGAELAGRPVSPGIARGPARLVAHPQDLERVCPGDILVTTSPDPGWTPIFGRVAAMVTERGGQLSHGAVVAREYALPAVSGIPGLLGLLREGEPLLVDGTQGIVLRLEEGKNGVGEGARRER